MVERRASDRKVAEPLLELIMRCCVLGKDTLAYFSLRPGSLPVAVTQSDLTIRTQEAVLYVGVVSQMQCLVHTNKLKI